MQPKCSACGQSEFESKFVENQKMYLVFCSACGQVVGVMPDHVEVAKSIVRTLTGGCRDGHGHPVIHVKTADSTFG